MLVGAGVCAYPVRAAAPLTPIRPQYTNSAAAQSRTESRTGLGGHRELIAGRYFVFVYRSFAARC